MTTNESKPVEGADFSRDTLKKFSKPELVALGKRMYGLQLHAEQSDKNELIDNILSKARQFQGNAEMRVVAKDDSSVEVPPGYVKIRVSPGDHNPNARPVVVGMNFKMATIPVNRDVVMPGYWMSCLEDAVEKRYHVGRDNYGNEELLDVEQHKYPFSLIVDNR